MIAKRGGARPVATAPTAGAVALPARVVEALERVASVSFEGDTARATVFLLRAGANAVHRASWDANAASDEVDAWLVALDESIRDQPALRLGEREWRGDP